MTTMSAIDDLATAYLTRLHDLAEGTNHIDCFYLFSSDDRLYDLEQELANSDGADAFYAELLSRYRAWKEAMSPVEWAEVVAYNDALTGADRNWLLDEVET